MATPLDRLIEHLDALVARRALDDIAEMRAALWKLVPAFNALEKRVEELEEHDEKTGDIYVGELKKRIADADESTKHWVRYAVSILVGLAITGGSILLGYAAHSPPMGH